MPGTPNTNILQETLRLTPPIEEVLAEMQYILKTNKPRHVIIRDNISMNQICRYWG